MSESPSPSTPLYVRLPNREAALLDRAAGEQRVSKRALVTSLVQRYLGEEVPLIVDSGSLARGRHSFRPAETPEVLTLVQAAELLQIGELELAALAQSGALPARRLGGGWRFARAALLAWLAAGDEPLA